MRQKLSVWKYVRYLWWHTATLIPNNQEHQPAEHAILVRVAVFCSHTNKYSLGIANSIIPRI